MADRVESEPLVELFRPVVLIRDQKDEIGAGRPRLVGGAKDDGGRKALAAILLLRRDVLDLTHPLRDVEVGPADDLAVNADAEEARVRPRSE
jgi:hypothetical protein